MTSTSPWIIGMSCWRTAVMASVPSPLMAKTCSTISAPPRRTVIWNDSTATTGTRAFFSACLKMTRRHDRPCARAARM